MQVQFKPLPKINVVLGNVGKSRYKFNTKLLVSIIGIFIISSALVWAGVTLLAEYRSNINIASSAVLVSSIPASLSASAGDYREFQSNVTNNANQQLLFQVRANITGNVTLINGDVKLRLVNESNDIVASSNSVVSNYVTLLHEQTYTVGQKHVYNVTVEWNSSATPGQYNLSFAVAPANFTFK